MHRSLPRRSRIRNTYMARSPLIQKGKHTVGLFTNEFCRKGDVLARYVGELVETGKCKRFKMSARRGTHFITVKGHSMYAIDGSKHGKFPFAYYAQNGAASFANSSKSPNATAEWTFMDQTPSGSPRRRSSEVKRLTLDPEEAAHGHCTLVQFLLIANKNMERHTEITWDYKI